MRSFRLSAKIRLKPASHLPSRSAAPAMFEVGFSEILLIVVIALIVLGPQNCQSLPQTSVAGLAELALWRVSCSNQLNEEINLEKMAQANDIKNAKPPRRPHRLRRPWPPQSLRR